MSLELTGRILKVGAEQSGTTKAGNAWKKIEFIISYMDGSYEKNAAFSCMGERTEAVKRFKAGDEVKVSFNIESREYNEKFYTDLRAWRIEQLQAGSVAASQTESGGYSANDAPVAPIAQTEGGDDLPF